VVDWKRPPEEVLHHEQADPEVVRRHAEEGRAAAAASPTGVAYEKADVDPPSVFRLGLVLAVATIGTVAASFGLFKLLRSQEAKSEPARPPLAIREVGRVPPEPRLQTTPRSDLAVTEEQQKELVDGYAWADRNAGRVRIPIEDAMRIYVERQRQRTGTGTATEASPDASVAGEPTDASAPYPPGRPPSPPPAASGLPQSPPVAASPSPEPHH
jgi:hypothetical protein